LKSEEVDYNKMIKEMADLSQDYFAEIHESLRHYREIIVPNPTVEDLTRYLDQHYPTYRIEPQYIHVPREYHLEYLRLLVVFDLPEYCRQPEWAFSLFQQAVADELPESITILLAHRFLLNDTTRNQLQDWIFDVIFEGATQSGTLPDLSMIEALINTDVFLKFDFSKNDILIDYYRNIFAHTDPHYLFEKHLLETVKQHSLTSQ
jgi:hypothetical protein